MHFSGNKSEKHRENGNMNATHVRSEQIYTFFLFSSIK